MMNGLTTGYVELEPLLGAEPVPVTVVGDWDTRHVLHDEVGPPAIRGSGVKHFGNVGMVHDGERLPFGFEASDDLLRIHPCFDYFEGHPPFDGRPLLRHEDSAHATFTNRFEQLVWADLCAHTFDTRQT